MFPNNVYRVLMISFLSKIPQSHLVDELLYLVSNRTLYHIDSIIEFLHYVAALLLQQFNTLIGISLGLFLFLNFFVAEHQ